MSSSSTTTTTTSSESDATSDATAPVASYQTTNAQMLRILIFTAFHWGYQYCTRDGDTPVISNLFGDEPSRLTNDFKKRFGVIITMERRVDPVSLSAGDKIKDSAGNTVQYFTLSLLSVGIRLKKSQFSSLQLYFKLVLVALGNHKITIHEMRLIDPKSPEQAYMTLKPNGVLCVPAPTLFGIKAEFSIKPSYVSIVWNDHPGDFFDGPKFDFERDIVLLSGKNVYTDHIVFNSGKNVYTDHQNNIIVPIPYVAKKNLNLPLKAGLFYRVRGMWKLLIEVPFQAVFVTSTKPFKGEIESLIPTDSGNLELVQDRDTDVFFAMKLRRVWFETKEHSVFREPNRNELHRFEPSILKLVNDILSAYGIQGRIDLERLEETQIDGRTLLADNALGATRIPRLGVRTGDRIFQPLAMGEEGFQCVVAFRRLANNVAEPEPGAGTEDEFGNDSRAAFFNAVARKYQSETQDSYTAGKSRIALASHVPPELYERLGFNDRRFKPIGCQNARCTRSEQTLMLCDRCRRATFCSSECHAGGALCCVR